MLLCFSSRAIRQASRSVSSSTGWPATVTRIRALCPVVRASPRPRRAMASTPPRTLLGPLASGQPPPYNPGAEGDHDERGRHLDAAAHWPIRFSDQEIDHDPDAEQQGEDAHQREGETHVADDRIKPLRRHPRMGHREGAYRRLRPRGLAAGE